MKKENPKERRYFLMIVILMLFSIVSFSQEKSFSVLMNDLESLEEAGKYQEALTLLQSAVADSDEEEFALLKKQISLNESLGIYDANPALFCEGHEKGLFFLLHERLPQYKPYLSFPGFDSVIVRDKQLRAEAMSRTHVTHRLILPENYNDTKSYPLFLIFHGGGSNLENVMKHWNSPVLKERFIRVYLRSNRPYDSFSYGWRSDDTIAMQEVDSVFRLICESYKVDTSHSMVAGISAGGSFAVKLAFEQVIPVAGFLAFCPGMPPLSVDDGNPANTWFQLRGYIVGGTEDYYLPKQRELVKFCSDAGVLCEHIVIDGGGHAYPEDENTYIEKGIRFITNQIQP